MRFIYHIVESGSTANGEYGYNTMDPRGRW